MTRSALSTVLLLSLLAPAARGQDGGKAAPPPAPAPGEKPSAPASAPPAPAAPAAVAWAKDLDAAKTAAKEQGRRILAVLLEDFYPSEPCGRLEKALEDAAAREALAGFVPLRVVEKEDLAFAKSLGLDDLGHPCTAILDAEGRALAWLRGAFDGAAWAKEVRRLGAALDALESKRAAAEKAPADAKALWELSEGLRAAGRVRDADDALARAENADPEGRTGLSPLLRYRRLEARVEDRMAVQDFEGARTLLDAYDREFPASPRRPWVAFLRAVARAYRGEVDGALEDLREIAASAKDEELLPLVTARIAALEKVLEKKK